MKRIDLRGLPFADLRQEDNYYVDKTLLIRDLLETDDRGIYMFTRPRRFGKTTNITMLDAFFNVKYKGNTWFDGLAISDHPEFDRYRNTFPVIRMNLSGTKSDNYDEYIDRMRIAVRYAYEPHRYLLEEPDLDPALRDNFVHLDMMDLREDLLSSSIELLSSEIARIKGIRPVILIDEYDAALTSSYGKESHGSTLGFLKGFLESSLKTDGNVQMAYLTGIMPIPKGSILSDLNVSVHGISSELGDERFGFTADEVKEVLEYYGGRRKYRTVKKQYCGYRFGNAEMYSPYSIMNYVAMDFEPDPYWIDSGSDVLIKRLLETLNDGNFADVLGLVTGGSIVTELDSGPAYGDLESSGGYLYGLMAVTGYLRAVPAEDERYRMSVPNGEVRDAVDRMMRNIYHVTDHAFNCFDRAVLEGDADAMTEALKKAMSGTRFKDLTDNACQAVMLSIIHRLSGTYRIGTECVRGGSDVDVVLRSRTRSRPNVILGIRVADSEKRLDEEVDGAMRRLRERGMGMPGRVILVGLAFWMRVPKGRIEIIDNDPDGDPSRRGTFNPAHRNPFPACLKSY